VFSSKNIRAKREPLTKELLLSKVREEDLLCHYLGFDAVDFNRYYVSPLRIDRKPTCRFYRTSNGICFHDFSGDFHGDVFDVVQRLKSCTFREALLTVQRDFLLEDAPSVIDYQKTLKEYEAIAKQKTVIQVKRREWLDSDLDWWASFGITKATLEKYRVAPVTYVWVDEELRYTHRTKDPAYAYYFGNGDYKIYFPFRDKYRFLSNGPHLQGWCELDMSTELVIWTKSLKDVMALSELGYSALAPPSEGALLNPESVDMLKNYNQLILFDNDKTGIQWAIKNSEEYDIPYNYLEVGNAKDMSDLVKEVGLERARKELSNLIKHKKHGTRKNNCSILKHKWNSRNH
jgi:hypothetical protein